MAPPSATPEPCTLASPLSNLYRYNLATGQTTDLGRSPILTGKYYNPGRFLWVDDNGRVYFTVGGATGSPPAPLYVLYWDPVTGWGANPDWKVREQLRTGAWSLDHRRLYTMTYQLDLYMFDQDAGTWTQVQNRGILDSDHVSPRTRGVRVRSMNLAPGEQKLMFVNDTAPAMSFFEWEFRATNVPREIMRISAMDSRVDSRYTAFTGHDSWDGQGRFYFTGFGGEGVPSTPNVYFLRIDPVRLKAGLGLLAGVPVVGIRGAGPGLHLLREGDMSTDLNVILRRTSSGGAVSHETVAMPAGVEVLHLPAGGEPGAWDDMKSVRVVPDGDTYVTDGHHAESDLN